MKEVGSNTYGHDGIKIIHSNEGKTLRIGKFCSIAEGVTVFLGANHSGVIRRGTNIPYTPNGYYLTYDFYSKHKNSMLNVITIQNFEQWVSTL